MVSATEAMQPRTETEGRKDAGGSKDESQGPMLRIGPDGQTKDSNPSTSHRLFTMGKKSLPEGRHTEATGSERHWAKIGVLFHDLKDFTTELLSPEYREGDSAVLLA
jgi:hypothetical protein